MGSENTARNTLSKTYTADALSAPADLGYRCLHIVPERPVVADRPKAVIVRRCSRRSWAGRSVFGGKFGDIGLS